MSGLTTQKDLQSAHVFDASLFRREDDLLNVFRNTTSNENIEANFNFKFDCLDNSDTVAKNISEFSVENTPNSAFFRDFDSFNAVTESVNATVEFNEGSELPKSQEPTVERWPLFVGHSNKDSREESNFVNRDWNSIFTTLTKPLSAGEESLSSKPVTFNTDEFTCEASEKSSEIAGSHKPRKVKIFQRRKDVIIKTLLRKCRKFYLKDFNKQTGYLKTVKRKFGSSIYKTLLEEYLTKVFGVQGNEALLIFMGAFLYQQDLEDNLDLFVGPNFGPTEIKKLVTSVHEILYKYSHLKFSTFSKNEEFKFVFLNFVKEGSADLTKDKEYAAGFEVIKGQL